MDKKIIFSRDEMLEINIKMLHDRGVEVDDIAKIAYDQQSRYIKGVPYEICVESVRKILSLRDIFHIVLLGIEIDRLTEENKLSSPLQDILKADLGMFGVDEILGLAIAHNYGAIGQTNFGDIDVNKPGIVHTLNEDGKSDKPQCHTFLDDIVGAIAAAASTRVAQIMSEDSVK